MTFAVVIVTYNPDRPLLARVCQAIATQTLPRARWRLIVVDNASQPALTPADFDALPVPATLLAEPRPGQAYGRFTGLAAAGTDAVVLVDDDNVLQPDYLEQAALFLAAHPEVGALGGIVEPEYETPPAAWCLPHTGLLAVRNLGPQPVVSEWREPQREYPWCAPFGAGLVLRPECVASYLAVMKDAASYSMGRVGLQWLGGCEDCEIVLKGALEAGWQVAYSPGLRLVHRIPRRRLQWDYLRKLAYETGISWGEFCVRHRLWAPLSRWIVPLRILHLYLREHAWRSDRYLAWRSEAGRLVGRSRGRVVCEKT